MQCWCSMRAFVLFLVFGLVIGTALLSGCSSTPPESFDTGVAVTPSATGTSLREPGASSPAPEKLLFVTEEYPPFNYLENGTIRGISVDILRDVLRETNSTAISGSISVLTWSEAYEKARTTNNTVVFATVRLSEREGLFKWAGPFISERKVIFSRRDNPVSISSTADLNRYRIGVVKDDAAYPELIAHGVNSSRIFPYLNPRALIADMQSGAIDLWCYGETAGRYYAGEVTGDSGSFTPVYTLDSEDLYFAFNRNTSDQVVSDFQAALDTVRLQPDSTGITAYQRIVYRYVGVSCVGHPDVTREQVTRLVNFTVDALRKDAAGTLALINAGEPPFWDRENRALYVFVYDKNTTIVAEADNPRLIGVDMRGKTDIAGTPFRDQITQRAFAEGSGWVDYVWMIPEETGIYNKSAYFRLAEGSDSRPYVVVSGLYTPC